MRGGLRGNARRRVRRGRPGDDRCRRPQQLLRQDDGTWTPRSRGDGRVTSECNVGGSVRTRHYAIDRGVNRLEAGITRERR